MDETVEQDRPQSAVHHELDEVRNRLESFDRLVDVLSERLNVVLQPDLPESANVESKKEEIRKERSNLTEQLRLINDLLEIQFVRINNIVQRLDI